MNAFQPDHIPRSTCSRTIATRRGAITLAGALAIASLTATAASTGKDLYELGRAYLASEEFSTQREQISERCQQLLELKVQRMLDRGEITQAEFELAVERIQAPVNEEVFDDLTRQLASQQDERFQQQIAQTAWNLLVNAGFAWTGQNIGKETFFHGIHQELTRGIPITGDATRNALGMLNNVFSMGLTGGQAWAGRNDSPVLTPEEFLAALEAAQQRLEEIDQDAASRKGVRVRVRQFFDRWEMRHVDGMKPEQIASLRDNLREQCHAAFTDFIGADLIAAGWTIEPEGVAEFAWGALKSYLPYRRLFGVEDRYFRLEQLDPNRPPLRDKTGGMLLLRWWSDLKNGSEEPEDHFALIFPESVAPDSLEQFGLPRDRELELSLTKTKEDLTSVTFTDQGASAKRIGNLTAKVMHSLAVAIAAFGSDKTPDEIQGSITTRNDWLEVRTNPQTPGEMRIEFRCVLIAEMPNREGRLERREEPFQFQLKGVPIPNPTSP